MKKPESTRPGSPGGEVAAGVGEDGLVRGLGLWGASSMIVGIVIGSGIFLGVNRVAAGTGSPWLIVAVWVIAGLATLIGALCYAELGVLYPRAGGEYVFLHKAFGGLPAFLAGWTAFAVNLAGSAAALAIIFAEQLNALKPEGFGYLVSVDFSTRLTAACLIAFLSVINYFGVRYGGGVQVVFTVLKGALIAMLAIAALAFMGESASPTIGLFEQAHTPGTPSEDGFAWSGMLGLAMVAALFAYDGWTNVVRVGSEIKDPGRNIPRAMLIGILAIMALYILVSFGYLRVLGFDGFAAGGTAGFENERTVASNAASILFGNAGQSIVAGMILVSVFGSLNGITLSGPRIYFAMARDRLFPQTFAKLSRHATPGTAIMAQAAIGIAYLFLFDFNQLTDNIVFVSIFFYALGAIGVLVLRKKAPDAPRPYRVPWSPWLPLVYIVTSLSFVAYLLWQQVADLSWDNLNRLAGLLIVAAGVPVYLYYRAKERRAPVQDS